MSGSLLPVSPGTSSAPPKWLKTASTIAGFGVAGILCQGPEVMRTAGFAKQTSLGEAAKARMAEGGMGSFGYGALLTTASNISRRVVKIEAMNFANSQIGDSKELSQALEKGSAFRSATVAGFSSPVQVLLSVTLDYAGQQMMAVDPATGKRINPSIFKTVHALFAQGPKVVFRGAGGRVAQFGAIDFWLDYVTPKSKAVISQYTDSTAIQTFGAISAASLVACLGGGGYADSITILYRTHAEGGTPKPYFQLFRESFKNNIDPLARRGIPRPFAFALGAGKTVGYPGLVRWVTILAPFCGGFALAAEIEGRVKNRFFSAY